MYAEGKIGSNPLFLSTLEKGIRVLEAFRNGEPSLSLTEIAEVCGITKSAAQRFTSTWTDLGYLQKEHRSRRYCLTHKALELGFLYLNTDPLIGKALPSLMQIRERCGITVNLSLLSGDDIVYVIRIPGEQQTFTEMLPGRRMPAWATSAGRVLLSALPDEQIRSSLERQQLKPFTSKTELDRKVLFAQITAVRGQGFSLACEQVLIGQFGIAAPIRNVHLQTVAAVNMVGQLSQWNVERVAQELAPVLMEITQRLVIG